MSAKFGAQTLKTSLETKKTVFLAKFFCKIDKMYTYFAKFGQDSMWRLVQILFHNQGKINLRCMASKPRKSTSGLAHTVYTYPTLPKRFLRRPKWNEFSPQNFEFLKLKKNMVKIVVLGCHEWHTRRTWVGSIWTVNILDPKIFLWVNYGLDQKLT